MGEGDNKVEKPQHPIVTTRERRMETKHEGQEQKKGTKARTKHTLKNGDET